MFSATKKALTLILLTLTNFSHAQDASVFNRLHGKIFKETLYINFDGSAFTYSRKADGNPIPMKANQEFIYKNREESSTVIYYSFVNPIKYSFTSELKYVDDPIFSIINDFFSKQTDPPTVSNDEAQLALSFVTGKDKSGADVIGEPTVLKFSPSILMGEWIYHFMYDMVLEPNIQVESKEKLNQIVASINKVTTVDLLLYQEIKVGDVTLAFNDHIKNSVQGIYNANKLEKFNTEITKAKEIQTELKKNLDSSKLIIKSISSLLSEEFLEKFKGIVDPDLINQFKMYSSSYSTWLNITASEKIEDLEKSKRQLDTLISKLDTYAEKFDKNGYQIGETIDFASNNPQLASITIGVTQKKENGIVSGPTNSQKFSVAAYERFIPFASAGILTSNFSYPKYTAVDNSGVFEAVQSGELEINTRPALFLNLLTNINSRIVYPFLQVGIVNGEGNALIPVGLGFTIGSFFSLSGGFAFGERSELPNDLATNPIKDEADLQNRLVKNWHYDTYFSINIKFANLKK